MNIPAEYCCYTRTAIQVLLVLYRPLTVHELAEALVVDYKRELFDFNDRFRDPNVVLDSRSSLVSLTRFFHIKGL